MKYEEVYNDHAILWAICPANDMTGGYQDQDDLDRLLANPTKATAKKCLIRQMRYWFQRGIEDTDETPAELVEKYPEAKRIAEKYGFDISGGPQ